MPAAVSLPHRLSLLVSALLCAACPLRVTAQAPATPAAPAAKPRLELYSQHRAGVREVRYAPDGKSLVSAGPAEVMVWDAATGELKDILSGPGEPNARVTLSPDGTLVGFGTRAGLEVRRIFASPAGPAGSVIAAIPRNAHLPFALASDGNLAAIAVPAPEREDRQTGVEIWDLSTRSLLRTLPVAEGQVGVLSFSPDGRLLLGTGWELKSAWGYVWNVATGAVERPLTGFDRFSRWLAVTPGGQTLAMPAEDGVRIWDLKTGEVLRTIRTPERLGRGIGATFSSDGRLLALTQAHGSRRESLSVLVYDVSSGQLQRTFGRILDTGTTPALSPDGTSVAVGNHGGVLVWRVADRTLTHALTAELARFRSLAYGGGGRVLAVAYYDRNIRIWDAATGRLQRTIPIEVGRMVFSPDGKKLVGTGGVTRVIDLTTGKIDELIDSGWSGQDVRFSPDGSLLAVGDAESIRLYDGRTLVPRGMLQGPGRHLAFSPDGKLLAGSGGMGQEVAVMVWDARTRKQLRRLPGHRGYHAALSFSPDGATLATAGEYDRTVRLWDSRTWQVRRELKEFPEFLKQVDFTPDGRALLVLSAYVRHEVSLWSAKTGARLRTLAAGDRLPIDTLTLSPTGRTFALPGEDGAIQIRNAADGRLRANLSLLPTFRRDRPLREWVVHTPNGDYVASPGARPYLWWREGPRLLPVTAYEKQHHRPDRIRAALR